MAQHRLINLHLVSDSTGETLNSIARATLARFEDPHVVHHRWSLIRSRLQLDRVLDGIEAEPGPVLFTLVDRSLRHALEEHCSRLGTPCLSVLDPVMELMQAEIGERAREKRGAQHVMDADYFRRIDAVNYALSYDDGQSTKELENADVILVGVSRSGKTPTCLYLALQYGVRAANYPLIPEDFGAMKLPGALNRLRRKLFGLTILPDRLHQIRSERRPGSQYASLPNCVAEVREAEALMRNEGIPYLDTTSRSIEELASTIMHQASLQRHIY